MDRLQTFFTLVLLSASAAFGAAVGVVDGTNDIYLTLISNTATVQIEDQVSVVTARQVLQNQLGDDTTFTYAFPLPVRASATGLRWKVDGVWKSAAMAAVPQDSSLPGPGPVTTNLTTYLGGNALYYQVEDTIRSDSTMILNWITWNYWNMMPGKYSFASRTTTT